MIRGSRVLTIARFEFRQVVFRWGYVIATFGLPIFLGGLMLTLLILQGAFLESRLSRVACYGVVDSAGPLREFDDAWTGREALSPDAVFATSDLSEAPEGMLHYAEIDQSVFVLFQSEDLGVALDAMRAGSLLATFHLRENYLETGEVEIFSQEHASVVTVQSETVEPVFSGLLRRALVDQRLASPYSERVLTPMEPIRSVTTSEGVRDSEGGFAELVSRIGIPFLLGVMLLTALLSSSGYLVQTVANDKESKVVEVLLSSVDPDELLTGKLFGLGAAGILQFAIWGAMVIGTGTGLVALLTELDVVVPWEAMAISPVFFVMGYLFFGSLMISTGSLGGSVPESQKLTLGWAMLAVLPLMSMLILLEEPHGPIAEFLTWVPFSAPLTVIVRASVEPEGLRWYSVSGSLAMLSLATWLSIRFGARLFRVGLLLTGKRPSIRETLRQARLLD